MRRQVIWTEEMSSALQELRVRNVPYSEIAVTLSRKFGVELTTVACVNKQKRMCRAAAPKPAPPAEPTAPPQRERRIPKDDDPDAILAGRRSAAISQLRVARLLYAINPTKHAGRLAVAESQAVHDWRQSWPPKGVKSE